MFDPGSRIFLHFPNDSNQRVLYPFEVEERGSEGMTVRAEEPGLPVAAGAEVMVFFEANDKFQRQAARIDAVTQTDPEAVIVLTLVDTPSSAEQRHLYRVSTLGADLSAVLDGEAGRLADVNVEGLSIICARRHNLGALLPVKVPFEGREFAGQASVQSLKHLPNGKMRYGLKCVGDDRRLGGLAHGLHKISTAVQRARLKRLAHAA